MAEPTRRHLQFDRIDEIMPEVDRLLTGHVTVGGWTLGMICDHLARSVELTLSLPPSDAPPTREQIVYRRLFFRRAEFPEGQAIPRIDQTPDPQADDATAAENLRDQLDGLRQHTGPWPSHPVIGPLTPEEWLLFHARHSAHHLGFAVPV